ncbi:hypothetical protein JCM10207_005904 [Rhodosporidiobolus poonsookiae]
MQFPRAERFRSPPPADIPGPGAYDVPVALPDAPYKRGGLLEKAGRFGQEGDPNKPDTFGLYNPPATDKENQPPRKRVASAAAASSSSADRERYKQQLEDQRHRLTTAHEKEVAKLLAKVARLEVARDELGREKGEQGKEVSGLKSEIRHLTSKLTKTEALLSKHQATLPLLQTKLSDLQTSNESSRARKDAELAQLAASLRSTEDVLRTRSEELARARAETRREREGREDAARAAGQAVAAAREEARAVRVDELYAARREVVKSERRAADRQAQVESLAAYAEGLEARVAVLSDELFAAGADADLVRRLWRADRELLIGPERAEKEWRQRARADGRDNEGLRSEVEGWRDVWGVERERGELGEWVERERRKREERERRRLKMELEIAEGELDHAVNSVIPDLESTLSSTSASLVTAESSVASLTSTVSTLEARLADETERYEGELEEQRRVVGEKVKEAERERAEKRRVVGLLAQTRASEGGLREEVDSLSAELTRLTPLLSTTEQQQQTIDRLARLTSATEADAQKVMAENAELLGHGNQMQRIRHVAQLREELAESRKKHLATTSALAFAEQRLASLEAELASYRAVPSTASAPPTRQRVARPHMADALPPPPVVLHEPTPSPAPFAAGAAGRKAALSRSALPALSTPRVALLEDDDAPLLPAHLQLARTQPAPALAGRAGAKGTGKGGKKAAFLGVGEEGSTSVRMEGRMSVSELLG